MKFGQVELLDVKSHDLIRMMKSALNSENSRATFIALHVSFFNNLNSYRYVESLKHAFLYADGASIVVAARLKGFRNIQRSATTDIAPRLISEFSLTRKDKLRIGLIGGSDDFIEGVEDFFMKNFNVNVIYAINGFPETWDENRFNYAMKEVDLALIGMGVPNESIFLADHSNLINARLILTCGGWFGFLVGKETRAPRYLQKSGLEWVWRTVQSPSRLIPRYTLGFINFCKFILRSNF